MHRLAAVLLLVACSSRTATPPSATGSGSGSGAGVAATSAPVDAATATSPVASCLAAETGAVDSVAITLDAVDFCAGEAAARSCWHVAIAEKRVDPRPVKAPAASAAPSRSATRSDDGSVAICPQPSRCTTVKPPFLVEETDLLAATADGAVLVRAPEGKPIELYDVATWKRRGSIRGWKTEMGNPARFVDVAVMGPNIIAWADASPVSAEGRIYTPGGKLVGRIGNADFSQDPGHSWRVTDTTWLFQPLGGTQLIAVDVVTGKQVASYDLAPLLEGTEDEYLMAAGAAASADAIVFLAETGVVGVVTRATGAVDVISPPRC